ncbi:MAG: sugar phosphate isomerase/epimerase [Planctomycetes bacterium]|nr:sugar phosphate isomerase/epimerase [Planctomycetota bacterium]
MKFGVNLLLLGDSATPAILGQFKMIRDLGFDGVEIPIFAPDKLDVDRIRRHADSAGLELTASGAMPGGSRFYGSQPGPRAAAEKYLRRAIRAAADLGIRVFCGPLFKPVGDCDQSLPPAEQRSQTVKVITPLVHEAGEAGVVLAFEPLNRFETDFLNTVADGVAFCRAIKHPSAGLLLDTFHMHIEEKDSASAVLSAARAGRLAHFHVSENDRGQAGTGQVHWQAVAQAVKKGKYDGWVVLESFSQTNQAIRTAVSCWRPFYSSPRQFMSGGLAFVRRLFGRAGK